MPARRSWFPVRAVVRMRPTGLYHYGRMSIAKNREISIGKDRPVRRFIWATLISAGLGLGIQEARAGGPEPCKQKCAQEFGSCRAKHRDSHSGGDPAEERKKRKECEEKKRRCEASCKVSGKLSTPSQPSSKSE